MPLSPVRCSRRPAGAGRSKRETALVRQCAGPGGVGCGALNKDDHRWIATRKGRREYAQERREHAEGRERFR